MKTVVIIGMANCGTTYLARKIHEAGIPMWEMAGANCEDYAIQRIVESEYRRQDKTFWQPWDEYKPSKECIKDFKDYKELRSKEEFGFKNPRLVFMHEAVSEVFDNILFLCCYRPSFQMMEAWERNGTILEVNDQCKKWCKKMMRRMPEHCHFFDYNQDMNKQNVYLSQVVGKDLDLANGWQPKDRNLASSFHT